MLLSLCHAQKCPSNGVSTMKLSQIDVPVQRPLRCGAWIMRQTWHNLLFAHWPVAPEVLRPLIPSGLTIDTYGGQAWVGVIAFRVSGIGLRGFPALPPFNAFAEINVRTYVTMDGS